MTEPMIAPDVTPDSLTAPQARALSALLTTRTVEAAAEKSDVALRTIFRWLGEDGAFREAYRIARADVVEHAVTALQSAASEATEVLRSVARNEDAPAHARVAAAKTILDVAIQAVRAESLERRLRLLEAREKALQGRGR